MMVGKKVGRKHKRITVAVVLFVLVLCMCMGCNKENNNKENKENNNTETKDNSNQVSTMTDILDEATPTPAPEVMIEEEIQKNEFGEYMVTEDNVKTIGRTYYYDNILWLSPSAAGVEFTFNGTNCEITLVGDSTTTSNWATGHEARVAVYLNDELVIDELMDKYLKTVTIYRGDATEGVVRLVKLSESSDSSMGIRGIKIEDGKINPTEEKAVKLEFIGDSITCGYGVDDELGGKYSTANENASKTYAYKAAMKLNADYSMVSFSGYGIISGYTGNGEINTTSLLPLYYSKFGKSYANIASNVAPDSVEWDFTKYIPNIVVVNLGTNDSSYCGTDAEKCAVFVDGYVEFLQTVRAKNPDAFILCTLGIMGDSLYPYVEEAVAKFQEVTGDESISSMKFDVQLAADGYAVDWHPSEATHEKAADKLVEYIQELGLIK